MSDPSSLPPPESPPPSWVTEAPPPLSPRRKVLFAVAGALLVAIVIAVLVLATVVGSLSGGPPVDVDVDASGEQMPSCGATFPDGFSEAAIDELIVWYGEDVADGMRSTGIPDGFPAAPFSWSGIVPVCGSAILDTDGEVVVYLFYAEQVSRARFDGLASMLTAAGTIMTADDVPREPQGLEPDQLSGLEAADRDELYREFVVPDRGVLWLTLETDDLLSTSGIGELIIEYRPRS